MQKRDWGILLVLSLIYFASRIFHLTSLPIFVDEAIYSRWAQIGLHDAAWRFISLTDGKQPLFMWVSAIPLKIFSDPLFATRLVSVVSGWFTMIGVWYLGFLLGRKKTGYIASVLVILTPFLFFYDRFATVESMLTASGVWLMILGILLSYHPRLDISLILGMVGGLSLLVKSPALIYLLLIPLIYPFLQPNYLKDKHKLIRFIFLYVLSLGLSFIIYNVQRLSPWMHMIGDKNNDFVISPLDMLVNKPLRIWQNLYDAMSWLVSYITPPLFAVSVIAGVLILKNQSKKFFVISAWFWGPLMATVMSALLFRPRYIVFAAPFMLLYPSVILTKLSLKKLTLLILALAIMPLYFMYTAWFLPFKMPLIKADWDYTSGWAAGNGVKEISDYLVNHVKETGKDADVYTEGTFGLLPHGLELYTSDRTKKLHITGLYPIIDIPPLQVRQNAERNPETFFILNNTQVSALPPNSQEIMSFKKKDNSYIKLYKIFP